MYTETVLHALFFYTASISFVDSLYITVKVNGFDIQHHTEDL